MIYAKGYSIYGLLGGPISKGGLGLSLGMDTLRSKVRSLGVECDPSYNYTQWKDIVADIFKQKPSRKIFIWGHSFGANAITWIVNELEGKAEIDYIAGYDPSVTTLTEQCTPIGNNVKYALCIQGKGLSIPGHGRYTLKQNSTCKLAVVPSYLGHTDIDDAEGFHGRSLQTMRTLLGIGV